jgi:hypothetical protein
MFKTSKSNRIYELLTSANSDFFLVGEDPFNDLIVELEEMGETIIIDKIKDGTIYLDNLKIIYSYKKALARAFLKSYLYFIT